MLDDLIKQQRETNEILKRLEKTGTLDRFIASLPEATPKLKDDPFSGTDPWDYHSLKSVAEGLIADGVGLIAKGSSQVKYAREYLPRLYHSRLKERATYKNPLCLQFFENYEADNEGEL